MFAVTVYGLAAGGEVIERQFGDLELVVRTAAGGLVPVNAAELRRLVEALTMTGDELWQARRERRAMLPRPAPASASMG